MRNTITGKCAIGCSNDGAPWTKSQVVVMLSRTETGKDTTIVGSCSEAISIMWSLITRGDQWTDYIEMLLSRLTLRVNINSVNDAMIFDYAEAYPYRVLDIRIPSDKTGFVYFLVSVRDFDKDGYRNTAAGVVQHLPVIHFTGRTVWLHTLLDLVHWTSAGEKSLNKDGSIADMILS